MKRFPVGELRLDEKSLKDNLGKDNFIFVGSSTDMFADKVPKEWIAKVLNHCMKFDNKYLFQTKNPRMFHNCIFPKKVIFGTTLESNRLYPEYSHAPFIDERVRMMKILKYKKTMISIEPVMDFDTKQFINIIKEISPKFVSIGADSKGHNLPEPSAEKVEALIKKLKKFTEVKIKTNLKRLFS